MGKCYSDMLLAAMLTLVIDLQLTRETQRYPFERLLDSRHRPLNSHAYGIANARLRCIGVIETVLQGVDWRTGTVRRGDPGEVGPGLPLGLKQYRQLHHEFRTGMVAVGSQRFEPARQFLVEVRTGMVAVGMECFDPACQFFVEVRRRRHPGREFRFAAGLEIATRLVAFIGFVGKDRGCEQQTCREKGNELVHFGEDLLSLGNRHIAEFTVPTIDGGLRRNIPQMR